MNRRSRACLVVFLACAFAAPSAFAQDMTFDPVDVGGDDAAQQDTGAADDGGGDLTFDVIDTEAAAKEVERSRKAEIDLIRVIQRRPFLRRNRVEVAPFLGTNINDSLVNMFLAGGNLNYHLTEVMAVGVNGGYSLGSETDLFDSVIEDYELFPQVSKVQWWAILNFQYVPIYGKFALFNTWIIPWDTYVVLGAGWTKTELDGHPTLSVGVGQRYFMNRWFTLDLELRDNIYNEDYPGDSQLVNNIVFTAGVSFFLPPDFEYRTLK
jgi:outer membrane beta-barrel protein